MKNKQKEDRFNEMMQIAFEEQQERLGGQPDGHEGEPQYEMVNQPKHYDFFGMTVIDVIEKTSSWQEFLGFLKGTAMRYRLRAGSKPGNSLEQDIAKAEWYENKYDEVIKENTP